MLPANATAIMLDRAAGASAWERAMTDWHGDDNAIMVLEGKSVSADRLDLAIEAALGTGVDSVTNSGIQIGPEAALRVGAVFACRRVIAEDIAKMPRVLKQTKYGSDGKPTTVVIREHQVARVLQQQPCDWLTPFQFVEWLVGTAVTQRAAYALPVRDKDGYLHELLPLLPGAVSIVQRTDWQVEYHVNGYGDTWILQPGQLLQLTGPINQHQLEGYAVTNLAREAIGLAVAIEQSQARFHKNDMRPSGVLSTDKTATPEIRKAIQSGWNRSYGPNGEGGIAVLGDGFKYTPMMVSSNDAQTLQNRDHQVSDICRFFRVFPQLIMHSGNLQGYGSFEQAMENHTKLTLMPWVDRLEQALMKALLTDAERADGYHIHIDVDAIARGTLSDRVAAYKNAVTVYLTPNEIRIREGLDPIDDEAMNKVQLPANNTGLMPGGAAKPATVKPTPASADKTTS